MCVCVLLPVCVCSRVWVHLFLGLIDHREFLVNFLVRPSEVKCCSLPLIPTLSLSLSPFLLDGFFDGSLSGERAIEALELGSSCVGVRQLKCQTQLYYLGVYLK